MLTQLDQLWVADLTYIRLESEFVYLAVVLDAFSRRVIGWALDRMITRSDNATANLLLDKAGAANVNSSTGIICTSPTLPSTTGERVARYKSHREAVRAVVAQS